MDKPPTLWELFRRPVLVWVGLLALLTLTYRLASTPIGAYNLVVSLAIAMVKIVLVGFVFMRLSEHGPLNRLAAVVGPAWIFIMFVLIGADYFGR